MNPVTGAGVHGGSALEVITLDDTLSILPSELCGTTNTQLIELYILYVN